MNFFLLEYILSIVGFSGMVLTTMERNSKNLFLGGCNESFIFTVTPCVNGPQESRILLEYLKVAKF